MRILAIRGTNLASLPEFAIDFTSGPLKRPGLFAITGRTGAGKSTILDALCVALFDKTPRLTGGGAMVGRTEEKEDSRVNAGDVRSIIRQGTASGTAEVDFVGRDGRHYRSTWQARRARGRADGKFQAQTVSLLDIKANQPLGGTKMETLQLIQEKIGLTYDQFRRSVLLAQGEFAAFLKADGRERAELLEKITGTGIYARLSMAAFTRKRAEEQALEQLTQQLGGIVLMDDDQRSAAQASLLELDSTLAVSRNRIALIERDAAWYSRLDQLTEGVTAAEKSLGDAKEACAALQPLRERMSLLSAVEPLRPVVVSLDQAREATTLAAVRRDELLASVTEAGLSLEARRSAAEGAAAALKEAADRSDAARPLIGKARELDTRLQDARTLLEARTAEFRKSGEQSAEAEAVRVKIASELASTEREIADADSWLAEHGWATPVTSQWGRWKVELERYIAVVERVKAITTAIATGTAVAHNAEIQLDKARTALRVAEELLHQKAEQLTAAETAAGLVDIVVIRRRIDTAREQVTAATELLRIAQEARTAADERERAGGQTLSLTASLEQLDASLRADRKQLPSAVATRDEAARSLQLARAAMDLEGHRADLQDNEECPLCGSREHPYRTGGSPASTLLTSLEERFVTLREAVTALENRIATSVVRRETLQGEILREQQALLTAAHTIADLSAAWAAPAVLFHDPAVPAEPCHPDSAPLALRLKETATALLATLQTEENAAATVQAAVAPARAMVEKAREERDKARETYTKAEQAQREAVAEVEGLTRDFSREEQNLAALSGLLEHPLSTWDNWRVKIDRDSRAFMTEAETAAAQWEEWTARRTTSSVRRDETTGRLNEAAARAQLMQTALKEKQTAMATQEQVVTDLADERGGLLGGRPADEVKQELAAALKTAQERAGTAADAALAAEKTVAAVSGKLAEAEKQFSAARAGEEAATEVLGRELAAFGTSEAEVREILGVSPEWRTESLNRLQQGDDGVRDAVTRLGERTELLDEHRKAETPAIARDDLAHAREEAQAIVREQEDRSFTLRHTLTADAENRQVAEALLPQIEIQREKTSLWQGMSDLIGSADGKKFRSFAQSLTLDVLLSLANEHLQSLSPRFSLMRVPSSEMELQVIDRDMGHDIRGVNSISGGESFLVSLSLALGLSSLASGTTRIGSLFIDEGFGSLDQDTLEMALSTLDSLQASGRMVGVISHISSLTERIGTRVDVVATGVGTSRVTVSSV